MATIVQHGVHNCANPQQILFSDRVSPSPGTTWGLANLPKEALGNHSLWDETFSSPGTRHSRQKMKGQGKDFERGSQPLGNRDSKRRGRKGLGEGRKKAREEGGKEGRKNDIIMLVYFRIYNESILPSALESQREALGS